MACKLEKNVVEAKSTKPKRSKLVVTNSLEFSVFF